ncbi:MAG: hypothetical protein JSU92_06700 [Deltaproteobacteria bacterium]|nr:MAG: hypothetical protein JSU92_06700 [Deltaproteobacteria bacterium]
MSRKTLAGLLGILLFASPAFAARPLSTDDAGTVDRGRFETEVGYVYTEYQYTGESALLGFSLKHGLTEKFDFCVGVPYKIEPEEGLGGAVVGVKFALLQEKENFPAVSLTFFSGLGTSAYALNGILTKEISELAVHLNLGHVATGYINVQGVTTYSGAIELALGERLALVGEIVGEVDAYSETDDPVEGLLGGSLGVREDLAFDFGFVFGLNDVSPDWRMTVGLTYGF